jgi:paraquat-inducible protein A
MAVPKTARNVGIIHCHTCNHLITADELKGVHGNCPRCHGHVTQRVANSLSKTTAFLVAAFVMYLPANAYPILTLVSFGAESHETIVGGILQLIKSEQWSIAIIVFVASVFVPIFKIAALSFLVLSVHLKIHWKPGVRTKLYRFVEWIGRWSMIDIFMISVLIALVKLNALATVEAGPGALAFAAVILLTMFASKTFDPRLIWDQLESGNDE